MSVKQKDDKPTTSSLVACCQSSNTTPENSIVECIEEDLEAPNNNTLFHITTDDTQNMNATDVTIEVLGKKKISSDFAFPKRPKVDIDFQNIRYTVKKFSFQQKQFGE